MENTTTNTAPRLLYMFIGHCSEDLGRASIRFVVEAEEVPSAESRHFKGAVVAANRNAPHYKGYFSSTWCNPKEETLAGFYPSFVRVSQDYVNLFFK